MNTGTAFAVPQAVKEHGFRGAWLPHRGSCHANSVTEGVFSQFLQHNVLIFCFSQKIDDTPSDPLTRATSPKGGGERFLTR